jgi:hypothetical protein
MSMTRVQYTAAKSLIEGYGLSKADTAGAIGYLTKQFEAAGGTPDSPSEGGKLATAAVAGASAREAEIARRTRAILREATLGHTPPISPELARDEAAAMVDLEGQFEQMTNQPEPTVAEYEAQQEADAKAEEERSAAWDKYMADQPKRDADAAAQGLAVARVEAQRQALVNTGMSREEAEKAVADAPAGVEAPVSPLDLAWADLSARSKGEE